MVPEMFNCLPQGKGQNLSPNLDRLATEGVLMENQYVVSPVCTPSRYNCLTGNYASRASNAAFLKNTEKEEGQTVIQWNTFITENEKILPQYLKELGYRTGMVGKNHVIEVNGLEPFPDFNASAHDPVVKQKLERNYEKVRHAILEKGFDYVEGIYNNNPDFIGVRELAVQNMDWIAEAGLNFIDTSKDQPFSFILPLQYPMALQTKSDRGWQIHWLLPKDTWRYHLMCFLRGKP
jgi:arylsulfatase A